MITVSRQSGIADVAVWCEGRRYTGVRRPKSVEHHSCAAWFEVSPSVAYIQQDIDAVFCTLRQFCCRLPAPSFTAFYADGSRTKQLFQVQQNFAMQDCAATVKPTSTY